MLLAQPRLEQLVSAGRTENSNHSSLYRAAAVDTTLKILSDVLRRPPPSLEISPNEKEDYVRDNRWPFPDCTQGQLLGRGGFAVVWLASDNQNKKCAVKQIVRRNQSDDDAANNEILCAKLLRDHASDIATHQGQCHIVALLQAVETRQCLWLMQEYGGIPLSKMMFETNGINHNGTRIYDVKHLPFLQLMRKDNCIIKLLLAQILLALDLLQLQNIVHADLKPDNILIDQGSEGTKCPLRVRLCDFGSAFLFDESKIHRSFATPEYMPPEALSVPSFSTRRFPSRRPNSERQAQVTPWSFDIWSIGCLWLEILHGVPLWIPFECLLPSGKIVKRGLFGVQRRDPARIVTCQEAVVKDLPALLRKWNHSNSQDVSPEFSGATLLKQMLQLRPSQRICASNALTHPFLQDLPL